MSQTVSALLVGVVEQTSNRFFGSIGDSLNPLADAARRSKIEWIGVRYEEGATGSARPTLKLLLDRVAAKTDTTPWDKVTRERRRRDEMLDKQADLARSKDRIHPQAVARGISELARPDAIFVFDTGLIRCGPRTGSGKPDRSASSPHSTTPQ